jgi:hypothetical protein
MDRPLSELCRVAWSKLQTGSGNAAHVPNAILDLVSPDQATRESAYWRLDNFIVVQGGVYEAAYEAIPFLMHILSQRSFGRLECYRLLFEIANGASDDRTCNDRFGNQISLATGCRDSLIEENELFRRDASDPDHQIAQEAQALLECLFNRTLSLWSAEEIQRLIEKTSQKYPSGLTF